jgi:hypothetical protein
MICYESGNKWLVSILIMMVISAGFLLMTPGFAGDEARGARALSFTKSSAGLPEDGGYNFVAFGDFNNDAEVDIAFGGENYGGGINTVGLYAYTGDGGAGWTDASDGLTAEYSWGGLAIADADGDGAMELYATDEHWGASNNQGLKAYEYQSGSWTDSITQVTTPVPTGGPDNVIVMDITGDDKLDMVVCLRNGIQYFENQGGNPAVWLDKSLGLATSGEFTAAAVADMNGDDLLDIVACDYNNNEYIFIQTLSGNLWEEHSDGLTTTGTTLGTGVGDVNGDGHTDIIYGTRDNGMYCWLGNSGGGSGGTAFTWTEANTGLPTSGRYSGIAVADIDSDGDLDIIAPRGSGGKGIEIYLGSGAATPSWTKTSPTGLAETGDWYGASVYDIDGDGSLDIAGASWGDGIGVWLNNPGPAVGDKTPPAVVSDLSVVEVTESSIKIQWTAPGDDGGTGVAAKYDLRFSESPINGASWGTAIPLADPPAPKPPGQTETVNVTGLEQNTTYYFAVITADEEDNWSPVSNSPSGTTLGVSKPALDVTVSLDKSVVDPGEQLDVNVDVRSADSGDAVAGAKVTAGTDNADTIINPDSGLTGTDGKFDFEITLPDVTETTQIAITVDVSKDGYKTSLKRITITVNPPASDSKYNLRVTGSGISFSPAAVEIDDTVTIIADITNTGDLDAQAFTVRFYVDGDQIGSDQQYTQLKSGSSVKVQATWTAVAGTHTIKAEVIPADTTLESESTDNSATKSITVLSDEEEPDDADDRFPWIWLILILVLVVILAIYLFTRKKPEAVKEYDEDADR